MPTSKVIVKKSMLGQFEDGLGVYANKDLKKGEIVIEWNARNIDIEEFNQLSKYEQDNFCHIRNKKIYLYPDPSRHVNRSLNPNLIADFEKKADIALRDIKKGEELSIDLHTKEDF